MCYLHEEDKTKDLELYFEGVGVGCGMTEHIFQLYYPPIFNSFSCLSAVWKAFVCVCISLYSCGNKLASSSVGPHHFKKPSSIEETIVFYRDEKQIPMTRVTLPQQAFAVASSMQLQEGLAAVNPANPYCATMEGPAIYPSY